MKHNFDKKKFFILYSILGFLFGLMFPIFSTLFQCYIDNKELTFNLLLKTQIKNPLIWVIDLAPIILGIVASIGGSRYDQLNKILEDISISNKTLELEVSKRINTEQELNKTMIDLEIKNKKIQEQFNSIEKSNKEIEKSHLEIEETKNILQQQKNYLQEQINNILEKTAQISKGDLTVKLISENNDEVGLLIDSLNYTVSELNKLIYEVNSFSKNVSGSAIYNKEIFEFIQNNIKKQSDNLNQIASSISDFDKIISFNTENISQASELSENNLCIAIEGVNIIKSTSQKINEVSNYLNTSSESIYSLKNSSNKIFNIIELINDISKQTNLLALNALIEAARAGEHGKGFAVVAEEIKVLSYKTEVSTKEIGKIIKENFDSSEKVMLIMQDSLEIMKEGLNYTDKSEKIVEEILSSSHILKDRLLEISAASEEQSQFTHQFKQNIQNVNDNIEDLKNNVIKNFNNIEELNKLCFGLNSTLNKFTISVN